MKLSKRASELIERTSPHQTYLRALLIFAAQNPGFEWVNYATGDRKASLAAYNGDARPVAKQFRQIKDLSWRFASITNEALKEASDRACSGRLQFVESEKGVAVDYCTGQYWPNEYRAASLAVLKAALRAIDATFEKANKAA